MRLTIVAGAPFFSPSELKFDLKPSIFIPSKRKSRVAVPFVVETLAACALSAGASYGVRLGVAALGSRLSLGVLDENYDIARAAREAQIKASLYLLRQCRPAILEWQRSVDASLAWTGDSPEFTNAENGLRRKAGRVRKLKASEIAALLPEGGYAAVEKGVARLIEAEGGNVRAEHQAALAKAALNEVVALGGWDAPPQPLAARFQDDEAGFAATFAGALGALFKDKAHDEFFRIWLVLREEATNATVAEIRARMDDLAQHMAERAAEAEALAGGAAVLAAFEALGDELRGRLDEIKEAVDAAPKITAEAVVALLGPDVFKQLERAGVERGAVMELARRINPRIKTMDEALAELRLLVKLHVEAIDEARRGANLGSHVDAVLARIAEKTTQGDYEAGSAEATRAFEQWRKEEADRLEASKQAGLKLLDAGLKQDILRGDARAAAKRIETSVILEHPGDQQARFSKLLGKWEEYYLAGRNFGTRIDLEIAAAIARVSIDASFDQASRGTAMNNLGIAQAVLGERGDAVSLNDAIAAFDESLNSLTRDALPLGWAWAKNNLGNALRTQGQRGDIKTLYAAVAAYLEALEVLTSKTSPHLWATAQGNLGNAYSTLGERGVEGTLGKAVAAYRAALKVLSCEESPAEWANTQNNLGNALRAQGEQCDIKALNDSIDAYNEALKVRVRDTRPVEWAESKHNLGIAHTTLGACDRPEAFEDAVDAFEDALKVRTRETLPFEWAKTKDSLGKAFLALGLNGDIAKLKASVAAHREALKVFNPVKQPSEWAMAQSNLEKAYLALRECGLDPDSVEDERR